MGHASVDTTLNVYTQVLDGSLRAAVEKIGGELFTIVHQPGRPGASALKCWMERLARLEPARNEPPSLR
jgi:hypothetical protein